MIIYLATYPRCGSAVLRDSILRNFGVMTTNGYAKEPVYPPEYQVRDAPEPVAGFRDGMRWDERTRVYTVPQTGEVRQMISAPALQYLTPDYRERLAAQPEAYAVKTHELPFDSYYPGENVIQMVRHPGASLVSYWVLKRGSGPKTRALGEFIEGRCAHGSWSAYHDAWTAAGAPRLVLSYEAAFGDQEPMIRAIGDFLALPLINRDAAGRPTVWPYTLAEAHQRNPARNPGAGIDGWRAAVTEAEHDLLWSLHGRTARRFGYAVPAMAEA